MNELEKARLVINETDEQMAALFMRRMQAAETIAAYKKETGKAIKDPEREKALIARNTEFITDEALKPYYEKFIRRMIDLSCDYQAECM